MSGITAILTAYRRPNTIPSLVEAIRAQTVPLTQIWAWANEPSAAVIDAIASASVDWVVTSSVNAFFHARFALALTAPTQYVAIFDDDSIPGARWFENCLATMERTPGILGAAGVRLQDDSYATATKHGWHEPTPETVAVDLVGHAWFLRTQWLHYLFSEPAILGTNGEDIELAARALRLGGIACYCPPHPPLDHSLWGSTRGEEFGDDALASFRRPTHVAERDHIVRSEIEKGWRPLFLRGRASTLTPATVGDRAATSNYPKSDLPAPTAPARDPIRTDEESSPASTVAFLEAISESAERILFIGCGDGALADSLKSRQAVVIDAIEPHASLADSAKLSIDRLFVTDPVQFDEAIPPGGYDYVLCQNFERFREPGKLLDRIRRWLKPGGQFVACTPNVRHHSTIAALIEGRWPNGDGKTNGQPRHRPHRLYTRREIEKLLFRAGLEVGEVRLHSGSGQGDSQQRGSPRNEVSVGPLRIAGLGQLEAEEFYADRLLFTATPESLPDYGLTSIVIVTHNELAYTRQCVESIAHLTDEPYELIFVDNGSSDGTVQYLRELAGESDGGDAIASRNSGTLSAAQAGPSPLSAQASTPLTPIPSPHAARRERGEGDPTIAAERRTNASVPRVRLILNTDNEGFPRAANQGIMAATGRQILLLNNDTIVTIGWLRRMLRGLYSHPRIGLIGPCSNHVSGSQQVTVSYDDLACLDGFAWDRGKSYDQILSDTDRLVGFCLLMRRDVVEKVGLLDERFSPGNFEDDDYCVRTLDAGFRVVVARDAYVHHFGERTFMGSGMAFNEILRQHQQLFREKLRAREIERGGADGWIERNRVTARSSGDTKYKLRARSDGPLVLERAAKRISLCLIMRDNEQTIGPCLESIRPWVDEMVCVDTGSKDATPKIAERLGARVYHFPWCDTFSAARNESFRYALGDWIFWADSDDTIDSTNGRAMRRLPLSDLDPSITAFTMKVLCPGDGKNGDTEVTAVDQVKLIRNYPEFRWDRRIHEQIIPAIRRVGCEIVKTELFLVHSGADHSLDGKRRKLERDLKLLHMELDEFPDHPFTLFNLGMTYRDAKDYARAIDYLKRSIARSGESESQVRKAYALLVSSYALSGQDAAALAACEQALKYYPNDPELTFQLGGLLSDSGRYEDAAACYRKVLELPGDAQFDSVERGLNGYLARHNLGVVYGNMGRYPDAEEQFRQALADAPTFRPAIRSLGDALIKQGKRAEAHALVKRLLGEEHLRSEGLLLRGELAASEGDLAASRSDLSEAVNLARDDLDTLRAACHVLCTHGNAEGARGFLERLVDQAPHDPAAHHDLGTTYLQTGELSKSIASLRESLRLRPDHPPTLINLAYALKENGERGDALEALSRIAQVAPHHACATQARREWELLAKE